MFYCNYDSYNNYGDVYYADCIIKLDAKMLPRNVTHFQFVNVHQKDNNAFNTAVCPGNGGESNPMTPEYDWKGCWFDIRTLISKEANMEYSAEWNELINPDVNSANIVYSWTNLLLAFLLSSFLFLYQ